jgi:hypothetical protein
MRICSAGVSSDCTQAQIDGEVSKQESKASRRKAAAAERLIKKAGGSSAVKLVKGTPHDQTALSLSITLLLLITVCL